MESDATQKLLEGVEILGPRSDVVEHVLTAEALAFVTHLHREFNPTREALLRQRAERQSDIDAGKLPDFLPETRTIREGTWQVAPTAPALQKRRVEITGPVERKMMINALNSGASVFMADLEDALSPTWHNVTEGQANLMDAVRGTIQLTSPEGKEYRLNNEIATLMVRPRGWHLVEKHILVDGQAISASLFDFGLYFFHNAHELMRLGPGIFFYLAKLESHLEARLWNDVFNAAQDALNIPRGTIRATVLIETIMAAFEMEEILYELREHAAGLNAGRWDYIFSCIKKFCNDPTRVLPDRAQVTMTTPFMRAYTELLVRTCHKRGAHAIGGMAAFIPDRRDPEVTEQALAKVSEDKLRESNDGFDGTWVAHPDLVPIAMEIFDAKLGDQPHQKHVLREDVHTSSAHLLDFEVPGGHITEGGIRTNINVGLQYLNAWLQGNGAAAIHNLMEDTATAEISRAQLWQWMCHNCTLADGRVMTRELYETIRDEEVAQLGGPSQGRIGDAAALMDRLVLTGDFVEFLTFPAYEILQ